MKEQLLSRIITIMARVLFAVVLAAFIGYLIYGQKVIGSERQISRLEAYEISDGWQVLAEDIDKEVTLPASIDADPNEVITARRQLKERYLKGKWLMIWNVGQDIMVYIDDQIRYTFNSNTSKTIGRDRPYLYLFVPLSEKDAGKMLTIKYCSANKADAGILGPVYYGDKTSLFLNVVIPYQTEACLAMIIISLGLLSIATGLAIQFFTKRSEPLMYLGLGVCLAAFWVILNSQIRQFVFNNVSTARNCAFLIVALMPAAFAFYLDDIQEKRFHKMYVAIEYLVIINFSVIFCVHLLGIKGISEVFAGALVLGLVDIVCGFTALVIDYRNKYLGRYRFVAIGLSLFAVAAVVQVIVYKISPAGIDTGTYIEAGLFFMMICAIIDAMQRLGTVYVEREEAVQAAETLTVSAMRTLARTVDAKDRYTSGHSKRVAQYSREISRRMGMSIKEQNNIYYTALLHDVGKIGIPDYIINKKTRLNDDEYVLVKNHTIMGSEILESINEIPNISDGARSHHEHYDGKGYPDGLAGEEIPLVARIIGVADAYDAMTSNRSYRSAMVQSVVRKEIERCRGKQFDPVIADVLIEMIDEDKDYKLREEGA